MVRHKNRYIVIEINESKTTQDPLALKPSSLHSAVVSKVSQVHGDFGLAAIRAGFSAKYCNEHTRIAVVRARHGPHRLVASVLPIISEIENKTVHITTLYTGATIKKCFEFLVCFQQAKFDKCAESLRTEEEKIMLRDLIMNLDKVAEIT